MVTDVTVIALKCWRNQSFNIRPVLCSLFEYNNIYLYFANEKIKAKETVQDSPHSFEQVRRGRAAGHKGLRPKCLTSPRSQLHNLNAEGLLL